MKKLPNIYKNTIDKKISNNKEVCHLKNSDSNKSILEKIDYIFMDDHYSYNILVNIVTSNRIYDTYLVSRTDDYVVTLDNDIININDIKELIIKDQR